MIFKILLDMVSSVSIHSAGLSAVVAAEPWKRILQVFESPELLQVLQLFPERGPINRNYC